MAPGAPDSTGGRPHSLHVGRRPRPRSALVRGEALDVEGRLDQRAPDLYCAVAVKNPSRKRKKNSTGENTSVRLGSKAGLRGFRVWGGGAVAGCRMQGGGLWRRGLPRATLRA